jgi:hypothetical protein
VTIGFWVSATVPGIMAVQLRNAAANRSYTVDVPINNAATWEYKTVTFPGDVAGSWTPGSSGSSMIVYFTFGVGSAWRGPANVWQNGDIKGTVNTTNFFAANGNAVSLTGVVLLPGSDAPSAARSPYIMRPYDTELVLCQRYFETGNVNFSTVSGSQTNRNLVWTVPFTVTKAFAPSVSLNGLSQNRCTGTAISAASPNSMAVSTHNTNADGDDFSFSATYTATARV